MAAGKNLQVVKLTQGSQEYIQAESTFKAGLPKANVLQVGVVSILVAL